MGKGDIARYEQFLLSHNVFKSCLLLMRQNEYLLSKGLTLSQMTNFRLFQTDIVCRQRFPFDENGKKFSKRVENTEGKGEIACNKHFLLFPQCFQKTCTCKKQGLFGKVLTLFSKFFSVILLWPVHRPMLSRRSFNKYSEQYSFHATCCFPT